MPDHVPDAERLPAVLTPLVGREDAVANVLDRLGRHRLVSLAGPGGAGKTRVAITVAGRLRPARVRWVDLAARADAATVPRALAERVGAGEEPGRTLLDSVTATIGTDQWTFVLDNCEHLLPELGELVRVLLERCPNTRVLATTRQRLGLPGELVWTMPPLSGDGARQLFCERAEAVCAGFEPDPALVDHICSALDRLPLAIEVAAARARMLSLTDIAAALDDRLALTAATRTVDRHRSLRAVLDWSHRLLDEPERALLADLSVFANGFGVDAVREVSRVPDPVEVLGRLVDRSLVATSRAGGRIRYLLPDTVRMYAAERLDASGRRADCEQRFAAWCAAFAEAADDELRSGADADALERIEVERANLNGAVRLSMAGDAATALRIGAALWRFCALRGLYREGRGVLEAALAATPATLGRLRAQALLGSGRLAALHCDYDVAVERLEAGGVAFAALGENAGVATGLNYRGSVARERGEYAAARLLHARSREVWTELGDEGGVALATHYLALVAWLTGDCVQGALLAEDALERYRRLGDTEGVAGSLINLGACALYGDDPVSAAALLEQSLELSRSAGHREGVAWSLDLLGVLALRGDDAARAEQLFRESLAAHWALGDRWRTASALEALATVAAYRDETERAARVLAAATVLRDETGTPVPPVERPLLERTRSMTAAAPSAARLGRLAGVPQVVAELLRAAAEPSRPGAASSRSGPAGGTRAPGPGAAAHAVAVSSPRPGTSRVDVLAFGSCRVVVDAVPLETSAFGYAKPRELLCFLLDRPDATKDQIGAALWPWASSARLRSSFHATLHGLRAALPADRIVYGARRYRFDRDQPYSYDVEDFEGLVGPDADAAQLEAAVGLYRGDFLDDFVGGTWIDERRDELGRSFERALSRLAGLRAATGDHDGAIDLLHRVLARDQLRESAHRELMRCYAAAGDRATALRQYVTVRDLLRAELGAEPEAATMALDARIRRGDAVRS